MKIIGCSQYLFDNMGLPKSLDLDPNDFVYLGKEVKIWPQAKLVNTQNISIGHRTIIDDFALVIALGESVVIGKFVHIASFCSITGTGGLIMDDFSGLAAGVRIATADEDYTGGTSLTNPTILKEFRNIKCKRVTICKHAIIGTNAVILPGIKIGEGCAVGANALVTQDLEPWTVCVGIPAKPIRKRPSTRIFELEKELFTKYPQYLQKHIAIKADVLMINQDYEEYIAQTLESVLMLIANFDFKIAIDDDYSTDRKVEIGIDYANGYLRQIIPAQ